MPFEAAYLLAAGFVAGVINAIAGGGKLLVLPALMATGISPYAANITSSLVLFPGAASAAWQYRHELHALPARYYTCLIPCFVGALIGLVLLQHTSTDFFEKLAPWLILFALACFALQPYVLKQFKFSLPASGTIGYTVIVILFISSIYGGYFGAGYGFIFMAILSLVANLRVYQLSGLKNIMGGGMELMAVLYFAPTGGVAWKVGLLAMLGCIAGGRWGARYALRIPQSRVRIAVTAIGLAVTCSAFWHAYA
jgi:uncharacterized membrane protein YfcA